MPTATAELHDTPLRLSRQVPAASYVAFRCAFGALVVIGQVRFLARGWVEEFYLAPDVHLTYPGLGWVRPLPAPAMYAVVVGLGLLGLAIAVGWRTRMAAALFAIGFTYTELIDAALYLNHYWFISLAAVVLAVVPTARGGTVAWVSVLALRGQLAVVYVFAGVAKLNDDWLLRGEPLSTWLAARTNRPLIGPLLDEPYIGLGLSWAGALFDLTIVGWLLWRRSRPIAYLVLVVFHVATAALFQIGMFPWVMILLTPIFFPPSWPYELARRVRAVLGIEPTQSGAAAAAGPDRERHGWSVGRVAVGALIAVAAVNIALPLRHYAAEGNVRWNDDGYLLSWRVMLTERASHVRFDVTDPLTGATERVDAEAVLEEWQAATAVTRADLILATSHLIAADYRDRLGRDVEVRADAFVAWNGRLATRWIDPTVDMAALSRFAPAAAYVLDRP
ncbi:MAG: HTTM domain-containing protein [Actinomycetota bacterium]